MSDRETFFEPFDPDYVRGVVSEVFGPALNHYFRPRLVGAHKIAKKGPVILAPNHSGNAFPWDGLVLDALLWERDDLRPEAKFRSVFEKELTVTWWMRPWGIDNFWRRGGGVDMTFDNYDELMRRGERVIHYPEGVPGIGKGFARRYQLQRYSSSLVVMAARHGATVHPVHIVNAEWVLPFNYMVGPVDRLMQKLFRVPFLPLPLGPLGVIFPWLWYLALPVRMVIAVGDPIDVAEKVRQAGITDLENADRAKLRAIAEEIRQEAQGDLDRHVGRCGRWPYQGRRLLREWRRAKGKRLRALPVSWPWRFIRHERDRRRPPARGRLHGWLRDWDVLGYYLPFGWLFLALTRALRKPPCGYRGLSKDERRQQEGAYYWRLAERPLPPRRD